MSTFLHYRQSTQSQDDAWSGYKMWYYTPSIPASIIFFLLFLTLTSFHAYSLTKRRTWFCIPFVLGGIFEVIGYVARAVSHSHLHSIPLYAMQYLFLLLAPILFAASIYMILGRIIRGVKGEEYSVIRVNWLTKIFVGSDVVCFLVQMGGGSMLATAKTKSKIDLCNNIVLAGLVFQVLMFGLFVVAAVLFHKRTNRRPTSAALDGPLGVNSRVGAWGKWTLGKTLPGWKRLMVALYVTSVLITLRNLFRIAEYAMGWEGYLLHHEWVLLVFDGLLMFGVLIICIVCYDPEISKVKKTGQRRPMDQMAIMERGVVEERTKDAGQVRTQGSGPWS